MAFRKFGGIEYNRKNNYVSSNINNNMNLNITDQIGNINTKIVTKSHLDLDGQTMFNVGNVIFANGLDIEQLLGNVDLSNTAAIQSIFTSNNSWSGANTFNNTTVMSVANIGNLSVGSTYGITSGGVITGSSLTTSGSINSGSITGTSFTALSSGPISGGAISGSSLDINTNYGISNSGVVTGNSLDINTAYGISNSGIVTGSSVGITGTAYGINNSGAVTGGVITGTTLTITGTTGTINDDPIITQSLTQDFALLTSPNSQNFASSIGVSGTITCDTLNIGSSGTINNSPILTTAGLSGYASLIDTNPQTFQGGISFNNTISCSSLGIAGTAYGINNSGVVTGSSVGITGTAYGINNSGVVTGSSVGITGTTYGISNSGVVTGSSVGITGTTYGISNSGVVTGSSVGITGEAYGIGNTGVVSGSSVVIGDGPTANLGVTGTTAGTTLVSENISTGVVYCDELYISGSPPALNNTLQLTLPIYGITGNYGNDFMIYQNVNGTTGQYSLNGIFFPNQNNSGIFVPTGGVVCFTALDSGSEDHVSFLAYLPSNINAQGIPQYSRITNAVWGNNVIPITNFIGGLVPSIIQGTPSTLCITISPENGEPSWSNQVVYSYNFSGIAPFVINLISN